MLFVDQQPPISGRPQVVEYRVCEFAFIIVQRAGRFVLLSNCNRVVHHLLNFRRRHRRRTLKQLDRHSPIPNGTMGGTIHRLVLRRKKSFDLVVGRIDRPGPPRFVGTLAAQCECGFRKRFSFVTR